MLKEHMESEQKKSLVLFPHKVWERWSAWIDIHPAWVLLSIVLFVLILGAVKLRIDPPSPEFNWENRWWQIALHVTRGEGYISCKPNYFPFCGPRNQVTAMREPLPVLAFAAIAFLTKESLLAAAASIVLINICIVVTVFYLTRELSNTRTGLLAALLWACYLPPVRLFYSQISGDLFACLGMTAGLYYFLRAQKTGQNRSWLASGLLFGLAILSRSAVLLVAVFLSLSLFFWLVPRIRDISPFRLRSFYPVILFTFAWAVVISPWILRNTLVFGRPVIGSTLSGYYLYRQNYILPTQNYLRFVSGGEFQPIVEEMASRRPGLTGTENEAQMNEIYLDEAMRIIKAHPLRYLELSAYRFPMFWFNWKVNEVYGKGNTTGDTLMIFQNLLLIVCGVVGLWGRFRQAWPVVVVVVSFTGLYMAVMAHLPYSIPVVPGLVALSAIALMQMGSSLSGMLSRCRNRFDEQ
jgi:4-amino-4-deoxy-L-arabinose transferase-like glycosyltransferase